MAELTLPLFPLATVLYPGMILPLHIFEDRYRRLVHDLLDGPGPRRFGVIAIRHGSQTGDSPPGIYAMGCTAEIREATRHADGRYDLTTIGGDRFRLLSQDRSLPYLRGCVEPVADHIAEPAAQPATGPVQAQFRAYLDELSLHPGPGVTVAEMPDEPVLLSYVVAAAMILDVPDRQSLLEAPSALARLRAERTLLRRETALLKATSSRPAPDLRHVRFSENLGPTPPEPEPPSARRRSRPRRRRRPARRAAGPAGAPTARPIFRKCRAGTGGCWARTGYLWWISVSERR
jgi:Lon protease-like protein